MTNLKKIEIRKDLESGLWIIKYTSIDIDPPSPGVTILGFTFENWESAVLAIGGKP